MWSRFTSICQQFKLNRVIEDTTHYTDNSSSILDWFCVDLFLVLEIPYYCPILLDYLTSLSLKMNFQPTECDPCIPAKNILIRPSDPPWLNNAIKRKIRARRRTGVQILISILTNLGDYETKPFQQYVMQSICIILLSLSLPVAGEHIWNSLFR